jgi:hypothetical protein
MSVVVSDSVPVFSPDFGKQANSPMAAIIRERVPKAKQKLLSVVSSVDAMTMTTEVWADRLPDFPTCLDDDVEQAELYQKALLNATSKSGLVAAKANNAFVDIKRMAQQLRDEMQVKVVQTKNGLAGVSAAREADLNTFKNRRAKDHVGNACLRSEHDMMWMLQISDRMKCVQELEAGLSATMAYCDRATNLQRLYESTRDYQEGIFDIVVSIQYHVEEDATRYEQLLHGKWLARTDRIQDMRSSLSEAQSQKNLEFEGLEAIEVGPSTASAALVKALSPARTLASNIESQAQDAATIDGCRSDEAAGGV